MRDKNLRVSPLLHLSLSPPCSVIGEAEYVDDQPALPGELYGHYVLSTMANAKIGNIDASKALVSTGQRGGATSGASSTLEIWYF